MNRPSRYSTPSGSERRKAFHLNLRFQTMEKQFNDKIEGISQDLGLVKGGFAASAVKEKPQLIADKLGYRYISDVFPELLIGLGDAARKNGEQEGDVESFKNADLVMLAVSKSDYQPAYIALEVSYTVETKDVTRARRNAEFLNRFTGIQAEAVVAGLGIMDDAQAMADQESVHWYQIPKGDIQPQ